MCVKICKRGVAVRIIIRIDISDIYFEDNNLFIKYL